MFRPVVARHLGGIIPVALLLLSFGRLVIHPSHLLVNSTRATIDQARVVDAPAGNDLTRQFGPLHLFIGRTLSETGRLPNWDDRGFGGRPLIGNPQAGLFYPPVWLAWVVPAPSMLGWITVGHLCWAVVGMNRLTRTLGLSGPGRMVAGGYFVLNPYVLAQVFEGHYPHVWAAAWYPWAFAALIRLDRGDWSAGLMLAISLAAVLLTGHPQEGFYLIIALGCRGLVSLVYRAAAPGSRDEVPRLVAAWVGVGGLVLGLVAVELIPDLMAQRWTLRSARLPLSLASRYHPTALNAWQLVHPLALGGPFDFFGPDNYWETVVGVGLVPLILALVGASWTRDRRRVRGWIILVAAAVVFASGRKLGLFAVLYEWVPGIDRFRVPARALFLANLGAAVLAGRGVEALGAEEQADRWVRLGRRWLVAASLLLIALGWGRIQVAERMLSPASIGATGSVEARRWLLRATTDWDRSLLALDRITRQGTFWLAFLGVSAGLSLVCRRPERRRWVATGLGLLGLIELAGSGFQVLVTSPAAAFRHEGAVERAILQTIPEGRNEPGPRVRADEAVLADLMAVHLGLTKTDINDTFQVQHAADLYQRLYDLSRPTPVVVRSPMDGPVADRVRRTQQAVLDTMSVRLAVASAHTPRLIDLVQATRWPVVVVDSGRADRSGRVIVARNPTALPRAYVVPGAQISATDDPRVVNQFTEVDPRQVVLMRRDPLGGWPSTTPRARFRPAEWRAADPDRLVLRVWTEGPGLLVVADTWMPGWSARVDGRAAEVERGNHAQRVVPLPGAGHHEVIMEYQAPGFRVGLAVTLGAVVVGGLVVLGSRRAPGGKTRDSVT